MYEAGHPECPVPTRKDRVGGTLGVGWLRMDSTRVYLWLIHVAVWQKPSQCCNYPPVKINK